MRDRPNVLLVVLDTCRADAVDPYGAPGLTPALRDLAERGTAVRSAYATSSWTLPSHASLFTGLMPRAVGLGQAPDGSPLSVRPVVAGLQDRWLPTLMKQDGWDTRAVSSNVWVSAASGFDTGFGTFAQVSGHRRTALAQSGLVGRVKWLAHCAKAQADAGAAEALELVRSWDGRSPFFWFVNLLECHSPYLPPSPWNDLPLRERLKAGDEARRHLTLHAIWRASLAGVDVPAEALERMRHLYQRAVQSMDSWLADVLTELDRRKVLDETVVLVTSDHGENFGDEGLMGHAFSVDERLVRVPFIVAGPGSWDRELVSLTDVPRLLADAVGLQGSPYADDEATDGVAVSTLDPLATRDHPSTLDADRQWGIGERGIGMLSEPAAAATDGAWKVVRDSRGERAYDLRADSLGLTALPLTAVPPRLLRPLTAALDAAAVDPVVAAPVGPAETGDVDGVDSAALEAQLRLLGYL